MHKIYVVGDIDHAAYLAFTKKLTRLEKREPKGTVINVILSSDGGFGMVALAFYDRIRLSKGLGFVIVVSAIGLVASAAVLILAAGDKRLMAKNAWVMVHDDTPDPIAVKNRRLSEIEKASQDYRKVENQWNMIMESATGTNSDMWDFLHSKETYLTAEQCLNLGLATEVM